MARPFAVDPEVQRALAGTGYHPISLIGRGARGKVVAAVEISTGATVAVKVLLDAGPQEMRELLQSFDHPNLVRHRYWFQDPSRSILVMDLANAGNLADWIDARDAIRPATAREVAGQALTGLAHLHDHQVIHRDLKPSNLLLHVNGQGASPDCRIRVRIGDFGSAMTLNAPWGTLVPTTPGTAGYIAPELLAGHSADERSDLFSLGVVLRALTARCEPADPDLTDLVERLTQADPSHRPRSARHALRDAPAGGRWDDADAPEAIMASIDLTDGVDGAPPGDKGRGTSDAEPRGFLVQIDGWLDKQIELLPDHDLPPVEPVAEPLHGPTDDEVAARLELIRRELGVSD